MKIEFSDATNCPVPQFVVFAETKQERLLLKAFFHMWHKPEWEFAVGGITHSSSVEQPNITSFNFGLRKKEK